MTRKLVHDSIRANLPKIGYSHLGQPIAMRRKHCFITVMHTTA